MADPLVGKTVGGCRILRKLGEGGMGVAYQAHHVRLDRVVVIKFLYPKIAAKPGAVENFQKEAQAAARLEHPRITQVYDVGAEAGLNYIVMQFIDGETAEDLMKRTGKVEALKALQIIKASLEGLQEAHRHGIVHRDIKPSNILLGKDGSIRLADFGLALKTDSSGKAQSAEIIGTPLYISPEQIWGQAVDGRCDIYSMGATYYHMLAGVPPYAGPTSQDIVAMHVNNPTPDIREVQPDVSNMCAEVILKMMAKKPDKRFKDVPELLQALNSPGMVVADAADMMVGGQMVDIGVPSPGGRTAPLTPGAPPVPTPGGTSVESTATPLPEWADQPEDAEAPRELNPVSWRPIAASLLWVLTGASAAAAGLYGQSYALGATAVLTVASVGAAPAGMGLIALLSFSAACAGFYFGAPGFAPPTLQTLAAAGHAPFILAVGLAWLIALRLGGSDRRGSLTWPAVFLFAAAAGLALFYFALPDATTWRVLLDAKARHPRALACFGSGAGLLVLLASRNRGKTPEDAAPVGTFLLSVAALAAFYAAGVVQHQPYKEASKANAREAMKKIESSVSMEVLDPGTETETVTVAPDAREQPEDTPDPRKEADKPKDERSRMRRILEAPFEDILKRLARSGTLPPAGVLYLLFGIMVYWRDARRFEQEKAL